MILSSALSSKTVIITVDKTVSQKDLESSTHMKLQKLSRRFCRAKTQFSFHGIFVRLLFFSFGLNIVFFFLQPQSCIREDSTMCCVRKITKVSDKNTTAQKTEQMGLRVKDGVTLTSNNPVLAGKHFDKKVFLTIGIPSIKRKGRNYLTKTLDSLLYNVSEAKDFTTKIVVLLADLKKSARQKQLDELLSRYSKEFANGNIHVITVPPKIYPPLRGLSKTLNDNEERMFWRSKQAIDFSFLMQYCKSFSPYYLQLEDDVIATRDYDVYMRRYMEEKKGRFWFNLDFSNLGFIGKLYRSETLENQARFFRLFYSEMPVDLLLSIYRRMLGNDIADTTYFRNLFLHIGYESSSLSPVE